MITRGSKKRKQNKSKKKNWTSPPGVESRVLARERDTLTALLSWHTYLIKVKFYYFKVGTH